MKKNKVTYSRNKSKVTYSSKSKTKNAIRYSLFRDLISSMPARGGQQHHSPFAISSMPFTIRSLENGWDKCIQSKGLATPFIIHYSFFLGKWMRQGLGVDIHYLLFCHLDVQCTRHLSNSTIRAIVRAGCIHIHLYLRGSTTEATLSQ